MKPTEEALKNEQIEHGEVSPGYERDDSDVSKLRSDFKEAMKEIHRISDLLTESNRELVGLRRVVTDLTEQLAARDQLIHKLRQTIEDQTLNLSKLRESGQSTGRARNIDGWTVRQVGNYFRLYKSVGGKVHCIHVGRELDVEKAREKIRDKMNKLRQAGL